MTFLTRKTAVFLLSAVILAVAAITGQSAVLNVTNTQDAGPDSLRATVAAAVAGDTIEFNIPTSDPGYNSSTRVFTITLTSGEIVIAKDLTIAGPSGANIAISGNHASRIFNITANGVQISNLSLVDGAVTGDRGALAGLPGMPGIGGAVLNQGNVVFSHCTFKGNSVLGGQGGSGVTAGVGGDGRGGAIANQRGLTLVACTLSGNSAEGGHGGIAINTSLHPENALGGMGLGGAIYNSDTGGFSLINCTVTANSCKGADGIPVQVASRGAAALGGGIANFGDLSVYQSTLANNTSRGGDSTPGIFLGPYDGGASNGGGLYTAPSTLPVARNNIFALNSAVGGAGAGPPAGPGAATGPDVNGKVISVGGNLYGRSDGCNFGFSMWDLRGGTTDETRLDPKLGALGQNGGSTETLPLLPGSPAINRGDPNSPERDQRNFLRADITDIGAFEFQGTQPVVLANIATRLRVQPGDNAMIGGFIITGTQPKTVIVRGIGPSLPLPGALADPIIYLYDAGGALRDINDNWNDAPNRQQIVDSGLAPTNELESALLGTLNPGAYTVVVRGGSDATGIGLFEVYDLDRTVNAKLGNISTRGLVQTGYNVMIGGFIVLGPDSQKVIVRAMGPSLPLSGALANPRLELHDGSGALLAANDDWRSDQEAEINTTGLAPSNDRESALVRTLPPGNYTAIVAGVNDTAGVALVEVYALN
jgi:hypothetical protein